MSVALKKADGDLFLDPETGRSEFVSGPSKVSQEMFSLYATQYDPDRNWGTDLEILSRHFSSAAEFRAVLFSKVSQANQRLLLKQQNDSTLDTETEMITKFSQLQVVIDPEQNAGIFQSVADVGDPTTQVGQTLALSYKPISTRHVISPPPNALSFFK
jgi:hypothetical protein